MYRVLYGVSLHLALLPAYGIPWLLVIVAYLLNVALVISYKEFMSKKLLCDEGWLFKFSLTFLFVQFVMVCTRKSDLNGELQAVIGFVYLIITIIMIFVANTKINEPDNIWHKNK